MSRLSGKRVTSKHCPFGFAEMPADFINAYLLGSLGQTGTSMGACASFLYNLRIGMHDIQHGNARVAIIGNAEAPILPEIIEGYGAMGALASDDELRILDGLTKNDIINYRRACRPFSSNCGFTIAESAQFIVLFDDALAVELGANVYGSVADVAVHADGYKKSISAPGMGNYITVAKAMAAARAITGDKPFAQGSFIQAHGTGTPQNRVTESRIINEAAKAFGLSQWPVAAVKSYLGHSIGCAAGDQLMATLGMWADGIFPGITTIDHLADDVHHSHLHMPMKHETMDVNQQVAAIVNAKGFGGNNASAALLSPMITERMLTKRHGQKAMASCRNRRQLVDQSAKAYDALALQSKAETVYRFDYNVLNDDQVHVSKDQISFDGIAAAIPLSQDCVYNDMLDS